MFNYIFNLMWCQVLPDSEDEFEREYTNLSDLSNDLAEEYPHYKPENFRRPRDILYLTTRRIIFMSLALLL